MKLILVSDDDVVLDSTQVTREEYDLARTSVLTAGRIFQQLVAGDEAK
jgi:hypothetical protein